MTTVKTEKNGPVRTITLARPEKRNALDLAMLEALYGAFIDTPDKSERVIVLRAEGPSFCSGMDLAERLEKPAKPSESPIEVMLYAMEMNPLPIVGVVHGDAIAGGNELALHCDFVVASTSARFGMSLAQIGLAPTWFLTKKLMEVAGPVAAREILLLGDPLPSTKMHELGIIGRVAPPYELQREAQKVIDRLAANAPLSLRAMKSMMVRQMAYRDNIEHAEQDRLVNATRDSQDSKEGIRARLDKRTADFKGV